MPRRGWRKAWSSVGRLFGIEPIAPGLLLINLRALVPNGQEPSTLTLAPSWLSAFHQSSEPTSFRNRETFRRRPGERIRAAPFTGQPHHVETEIGRCQTAQFGHFDLDSCGGLLLASSMVALRKASPGSLSASSSFWSCSLVFPGRRMKRMKAPAAMVKPPISQPRPLIA